MSQAAQAAQAARQQQGGGNAGNPGLIASIKAAFAGKPETPKPFVFEDDQQDNVDDNGQPLPDTNAQALDSFNDLINPKKPDAGSQPVGQQGNQKPTAPVDPFAGITRENLVQAASKLNFTAGVTDEVLAKAASGDTAAFRAVINEGLRATFAESLLSSHTLMGKRLAHVQDTQLSPLITQQIANHELGNTVKSNPLFSHPATHPIRDALTASIRSTNPNISATDLNTKLTSMMKAYANTIVGGEGDDGEPNGQSVPGANYRARRVSASNF